MPTASTTTAPRNGFASAAQPGFAGIAIPAAPTPSAQSALRCRLCTCLLGAEDAMLLLVDVEPTASGASQVGYALREPMQLPALLERWFRAMNTLHDAFGVPLSHNEAMTSAALAAFGVR